MRTRNLAEQFEAYADWRHRLADSLQRLATGLREADLLDAQTDSQVSHTLSRLALDQLVVAFVAEFSRGKSELINAIFFADYGRRLLPTSAGRTTMCPTELLYTPTLPPCIRLLPIETRLGNEALSELRTRASAWTTLELDLMAPERMSAALSELSRTRRVSVEAARELGLVAEEDSGCTPSAGGTMEIPAWRHAIVNFPHPLLQQGLVVLDTPGLNAIGAEPELTLNLLPSAHAVVFILAADTGVTRSDVETWRRYVTGEAAVPGRGRVAVLNKIDTMWDELRSELEVEREIERQVRGTSMTLGIPVEQVYPVSAQKGLVAKVTADPALLHRSRLPALEAALSRELLPSKREIVAETTRREARAIVRQAETILDTRLSGIERQLGELGSLRGRNRSVVEQMLDRARDEREFFDRGLDHFASLRNDLAERTSELAALLGIESFRRNALETHQRIEGARFTSGIRAAMARFFDAIAADFAAAESRMTEIEALVRGAYERFAAEQKLARLDPPPGFPMARYRAEIQRLKVLYEARLDTVWNMVSKEKYTLQRKFFESIASRMKAIYEETGRDADGWLAHLLTPLETLVREHQSQLRRRIETIRRIYESSEASEGRLEELRDSQRLLLEQVRIASQLLARLEHVADELQELPLAANA